MGTSGAFTGRLGGDQRAVLAAAAAAAATAVLLVGLRPSYAFAVVLGLVFIGAVVLARAERAVVYALSAAVALQVLVPVLHLVGARQKGLEVGTGLFLVLLGLARSPRRPQGRPMLLFAATLAAYAPATLLHEDPNAKRVYLIIWVVSLPILALATTLDRAQFLSTARFLVLAAVAEAAYGYYEWHGRITPLWYSYAPDDPQSSSVVGAKNNLLHDGSLRAQGTLAHPLLLGTLVGVALAVVLTMPLFKRGLVRALVLVELTGAIVVAGDRSYVVIMAVLVVLFAGHRYRSKIRRVAVGIPLLVALALVLLAAGVFQSSAVTRLVGGDSFQHRSTSIASVSDLFRQDWLHVLFGNGFYSTPRLYESGLIPNIDGTLAPDDMWISALAMGGLVAVALTAATLWAAARRAERGPLAMLAVLAATFLVFDLYLWPSAIALLALVVGASWIRQDVEAYTICAPPVSVDETLPGRSA